MNEIFWATFYKEYVTYSGVSVAGIGWVEIYGVIGPSKVSGELVPPMNFSDPERNFIA